MRFQIKSTSIVWLSFIFSFCYIPFFFFASVVCSLGARLFCFPNKCKLNQSNRLMPRILELTKWKRMMYKNYCIWNAKMEKEQMCNEWQKKERNQKKLEWNQERKNRKILRISKRSDPTMWMIYFGRVTFSIFIILRHCLSWALTFYSTAFFLDSNVYKVKSKVIPGMLLCINSMGHWNSQFQRTEEDEKKKKKKMTRWRGKGETKERFWIIVSQPTNQSDCIHLKCKYCHRIENVRSFHSSWTFSNIISIVWRMSSEWQHSIRHRIKIV